VTPVATASLSELACNATGLSSQPPLMAAADSGPVKDCIEQSRTASPLTQSASHPLTISPRPGQLPSCTTAPTLWTTSSRPYIAGEIDQIRDKRVNRRQWAPRNE